MSATLPVYIRPSEALVLEHVLAGHCNKIIARRLRISTKTVEAHITHVSERLGLAAKGRQAVLLTLMQSAWERHAADAPPMADALRDALASMVRNPS